MFVQKVEYFKDHKLKILFNDNVIKIVDIEPIIKNSKKIFKPLLNLEYFKKVSLDNEDYPLGICWPNGADICPDVLYKMGKDIYEEKKSSIKTTSQPIRRNKKSAAVKAVPAKKRISKKSKKIVISKESN